MMKNLKDNMVIFTSLHEHLHGVPLSFCLLFFHGLVCIIVKLLRHLVLLDQFFFVNQMVQLRRIGVSIGEIKSGICHYSWMTLNLP